MRSNEFKLDQGWISWFKIELKKESFDIKSEIDAWITLEVINGQPFLNT